MRHALAPADAATYSSDYTAGFECSSRNDAFFLLQQHLAPGARLCVLADGNLEPLVLAPAFHEKELHIVGSSDGENYQSYAEWFFKQLRAGWTRLDELFEQETPAQELPQVFEQLDRSSARPIRVLVRYD